LAGPAYAAEPTPAPVTVNLIVQAHNNSILDLSSNGSASYYAGGWQPITTENANNHRILQTKVTPGTYTFSVTYNGTTSSKSVTVKTTPSAQSVYFHAALVNVELQAHDNSILSIPGNGSASYYAGGWHSITTQNANNTSIVQAEMLPGTYHFTATYNGTSDDKTYTVLEPNPNNHANAVQTVYFHAALVNVELQAHNNSTLSIPANGSASYYAGGWHSITDLNTNNPDMVQAEMLPGTYSFAATYNGTRDQKQYTVIEPNPNNHANAVQTVYFHTALVDVELQAQSGAILDIPGNGSASYYASGWHAITAENPNNHKMVRTEMLPGTYAFAVTYNGTTDQKSYTVLEPNPNNGDHANQIVYFHYPFN
jgi:hypothetical protein